MAPAAAHLPAQHKTDCPSSTPPSKALLCYSLNKSIALSVQPLVMQITLPPDLEQFVQLQLNNGSFLSANEVIQEALRLFQRTLPQDLTTDKLKEALQIGIDDIAADRSKLYSTVTELATDIKQLARQQQQARSNL